MTDLLLEEPQIETGGISKRTLIWTLITTLALALALAGALIGLNRAKEKLREKKSQKAGMLNTAGSPGLHPAANNASSFPRS